VRYHNGTVREECLDHILIRSQTHLRSVLKTYIDYYNTARHHQGLAQQSPIPHRRAHESGPIQRREVLGRIIGDYYRVPGNAVPAAGQARICPVMLILESQGWDPDV
jgi:hypothetical protein